MKKTSTILAISSALFVGQAQAEIESEFHVGYNSEYIYRGVDLGSDAYEYGLDFAGSGDCGFDWSAGIWFISPDGEDGNIDELDIYGEVSKDVGFGAFALGFTAYTYDSTGPDDAEVYLGYNADLGCFDFGLTLFYGLDGRIDEAFLLEGTLGYSFEIGSKTTVNIGVAYGYLLDEGVSGNYAVDDGGLYFTATASVDFAVSDNITFSPYISYVDGSSSNYNTTDPLLGLGGLSVADGDVIGGASLAFSF